MKKLRVEEVIVVEGKYDAAKLADLVDGLILTTNGFSVFKNAETKRLLVELGKKRGIIVLTDSDDAGFRIRNYINKLAQGICVKNAYVPAIAGKERRKAHRLPPVLITSSTMRMRFPSMESRSLRSMTSFCTASVVMETSSTTTGSSM